MHNNLYMHECKRKGAWPDTLGKHFSSSLPVLISPELYARRGPVHIMPTICAQGQFGSSSNWWNVPRGNAYVHIA